MFGKRVGIAVMLVLISCCTALSEAERIVPDEAIPLFLKMVTYDENFREDELNSLTVYIAFDESISASYEQLLQCQAYFESNPDLQVHGTEVAYRPLPVSQLKANLGSESDSTYDIVLVTGINDKHARELALLARDRKVRTFALETDHIELGLSVSVDPGRKQHIINVHLEASRSEGSRFSAHLLKICKIYKDEPQ